MKSSALETTTQWPFASTVTALATLEVGLAVAFALAALVVVAAVPGDVALASAIAGLAALEVSLAVALALALAFDRALPSDMTRLAATKATATHAL